jgi:hypothetical protein
MPDTDGSHFIFSDCCRIWGVWVIILILPFLILGWLLLAPLQIQIDTRIPEISFRWISIGRAKLIFEEDKWWLKISVLFFFKRWDIEELIFKSNKKVNTLKPKRRVRKYKWLSKLFNLTTTFRVTKWQIAMDTGDYARNAWLYPLNFYAATRHHLYINFLDENYFLLEIRNSPWKLIMAFISK